MFVQDRDSARQFFFQVWRKYQEAEISLQPLEELVLGVILEHPEYHGFLQDTEEGLRQDFSPESGQTNPFLHMSMHIAIKEQIAADRPRGIGPLHRQLLQGVSDEHGLEHRMMECLGESLWLAQRNNVLPDEQAYLECLRKIK